ncbi:hypothetical protein UA08_07558 [Talaromyces atroroseus]|uniref:Tyrosyl-DNA phosphodiesterase n=1 Tax=Talaromyces atroroseus TaxID=1441469 RepID=A0A225AQ79_TALAT|nr:hypothetical protein UA08_07558 [Talaromyces atroroseus]OKL57096.1 hypothetical protein UA08_07558 [Talaromyces atroroseus]
MAWKEGATVLLPASSSTTSFCPSSLHLQNNSSSMYHSAKKRKLSNNEDVEDNVPETNRTTLASLSRSVTPPLTTRARPFSPRQQDKKPSIDAASRVKQDHAVDIGKQPELIERKRHVIPSPIQLTHIRDLPSGNNVDTVQLHDILGDPMIRECWQFNYCFDIDFLMSQFDQDIQEACSRYPNVEPIVAYMPEPFGTHHSKMMILLRHDDLAQVVIHTANILAGDWANMSQAVWRSPLLPLALTQHDLDAEVEVFGTGDRFKRDLLAYLDFYGRKKTGVLVDQLRKHDFKTVRAALIASVPSREKLSRADSSKSTLWGWLALKDALRQIPLRNVSHGKFSHIIIQVSSIASLGQTDKWLKDVFFDSLCPSSYVSNRTKTKKPRYSIVFPTPDEIRRSLDGYGSGGSIHMKLQSVTQQKQLQYMRPYLCQWAGDKDYLTTRAGCLDSSNIEGLRTQPKKEAGRRRAAPHIKTYIRFSDETAMDCIDWAMITSANLSKQAWGAAPNSAGEVRICSWEIGVLVWPEVIVGETRRKDVAKQATMVPCFKRDLPDSTLLRDDSSVVGIRMPYDLPLTAYGDDDVPWCATISHAEPDWLGQTWET